MDTPFWQLALAGFIGSMIGRVLIGLRKRKSAHKGRTMKSHMRTLALSTATGTLAATYWPPSLVAGWACGWLLGAALPAGLILGDKCPTAGIRLTSVRN